jgi:uncharacterized protein (TIGR03435 family)
MSLEMYLAHPAVQALGRALLHFLWQGSLLALLLWVVRTIAPASAARVRYAAAGLVLTAMPLVLMVTIAKDPLGARLKPRAVGSLNTKQVTRPVAQAVRAGAMPNEAVLYAPTASKPQAGLSGWAVCIWITGVFALSLRALGGWTRAQRLKVQVQAGGADLEAMLRRLKSRMGVSAPVRVYTSAIARVPMVIGWIRPYILLPVTALTGLSAAQIDALLAHELAHIRRHDYLVNLFQTAIETALFYHPAVWWVGKQMRLEREHCCDDMAVAICGNVLEYANALAEMEEIRGRNMEPAMAANGGELIRRIRRLLGRPEPPSLSAMLVVVLPLLMAGASAVVSVRAAAQETQPAFDVASIRSTPAGIDPGPRFGLGPRTHVESATLKSLVLLAYDVKDFQVSGGPGWTNSDRYDIDATVEGESRGTGPAYRTLILRRLQTLLRDRFKLAVHRETKELPIYELVVAKGGFKLQPVKEGSCVPFDAEKFRAPGTNPMDFCGYGGFGRGFYEASTVSMADLAYALPMAVGRTVVDKTGITGVFRIHLTYQFVSPPTAPPDGAGNPASADDAGLSIFTALQEQLGLKLESSKGPVEVLVIDHVEKPSEN